MDSIELLKGEFGKEAPLRITLGCIHDYLGTTLDTTEPGRVNLGMIDHVDNALRKLPEDLSEGVMSTPASKSSGNNDTLLDAKTLDVYHHNAAKLLFVPMMQAGPN
jgi:hypothetical protein